MKREQIKKADKIDLSVSAYARRVSFIRERRSECYGRYNTSVVISLER